MSGRPFKVVKYATDITAEKAKVDSILEVVNAAAKGDLTLITSVSGSDLIGRVGDGLEQVSRRLAPKRQRYCAKHANPFERFD